MNRDDDRQRANTLFAEGNYREAMELYQKLWRSPETSAPNAVGDWNQTVQCLHHLQRVHEFDGLLEEFVGLRAGQWQALHAAASSLIGINSYGFVTAGKFSRGDARGGGEWADSSQRDRVRALQLLAQALPLVADEPDPGQKANFFQSLARTVAHGRIDSEPWRLQELTDLTVLPDLETGGRWHRQWGWTGEPRGAPVDADGNPVFHTIPASWESAESDGQRWRWALEESARHQPALKPQNQWTYIQFLHNQFGVQTLAGFGINLLAAERNEEGNQGGSGQEIDPRQNPLALRTLTDDETIARLATGVRRFTLPAEHNPVRIAQALAELKTPEWGAQALEYLAGVYADRQQFPAAALKWQQVIERFGSNDFRRSSLDQIIRPWGMLEPVRNQPAGQGAAIEYRYRNGRSVKFEARVVDHPRLIADAIKYLNSSPAQFEWERTIPGPSGPELLERLAGYVGEKVADWTVELSPRPEHRDRRTTISTPLQKAGLYLVTAQMADGNKCHVLVEVDDLMLLRKPAGNQTLYFLADAVSGAPVAGADVEFFGWRNEWDDRAKRNRVITRRMAERSDADGMIAVDPKLMENGMQWLAVARTKDGRHAWLGYSWIWHTVWSDEQLERAMTYVITDRPIYRPGQKVFFRAWAREASYRSASELAKFAGEAFELVITDPMGTEVRREKAVLDDAGSFTGELELGPDAKLGAWQLNLVSVRNIRRWGRVAGSLSFRVEEYRKPEFEVTVEAPSEPVRLGETITAKIKAAYYFGGPVNNAEVRYKVHRTARDARWFPVRQWDWLYGNGYWWFTGDSVWYPGFARWGCFCPVPPWWSGPVDPPELVIDEVASIRADGTVDVRIDTALAKALHSDQDHEYTITAEVTDSSRRTIVGTGSVTVARQAFRVYCWTDVGYSRVGENFTASFSARTPDGKGVRGRADVRLLKVTWKPDDQPEETIVRTWDNIALDESGGFSQIIQSSEPGQFRITATVDDGHGNRFEGAQLLTITGAGFDGADFRFGDLEVTADRAEYAPGEKVRLLINTNRTGSTVLLWLRPVNGVYAGRPKVLRLKGKSEVVEIDVLPADTPNFFVEASTVSSARLHEVTRNIVVPPVSRSLNVEVETSSQEYLPGADATVTVRVTDQTGEPVAGDIVLTMYDRAIEYISGGSNVPDIREFFWKWVRSHNPNSEHSLGRVFGQFVTPGDTAMSFLGVFGQFTADQDEETAGADRARMNGMPGGGGGGGGAMMRRGPGGMGGGMAVAEAAPMAMAAEGAADNMMMKNGGEPQGGPGGELAPAAVRSNFADSAIWRAAIQTGPDGRAELKFTMPENLTAWKIRSWSMGPGTAVGEATTEVTTKKNILVRLQAPRFFVERDEIVLSAVVHNYLDAAKQAVVSLDLSGGTLEAIDGASRTVEIPSGGDVRVDWRVKAIREGNAAITMTAQTDVESDAMKMEFPVYVHGMLRTESYSRVVRATEERAVIDVTVPEERRPDQTRLEVRFSPTLAGAMVDALPYLVEYPYGCTEQTLNRFVPTVITLNILRRMNVDLADIRDKRTNLNAQQIGDPAQRAAQWKVWDRNPVFDQAEVERMVKQGISDLTAMQCSDGGWGWFSGFGERSWPHTTAVVVHGLQTAVAADMAIPGGVLERGVEWLKGYEQRQIELLDEWERIRDLPPEKQPRDRQYKTAADNLDALVHMVLTDADAGNPRMRDYLYRDRTKLTLYGMGLLGLALDRAGDAERRDMLIRNIGQFVVHDEENQTAYIDLPNNAGSWWYWYGDSIEANAYWLKLMSRVKPDDPRTAGVVKYLLNNRRHGTYWNSTRDTATCIEALAEYLVRSGEARPEMTVEIVVDGTVRKAVEITPQNLFTIDNVLVLSGEELASGPHKIELVRRGKGPLYANAYMTNFTLEDNIPPAGLEVRVGRRFYRLVQREGARESVAGDRGQVVDQNVEKYDRVELADLSEVRSGDLILVELEIDSKNDYEYVIFEDFKAAGLEPVEMRSGYTPGGLGAYVEFRDERVAFFMRSLARGKHSVSYRLRAETPGRFSALPARAAAMYAPELRGNSGELRLNVIEAEARPAGNGR